MITSQKPASAGSAPNAKYNQPAARATTSVSAGSPSASDSSSDSLCAVHRLEEALQLVESMQLTSEQKTKIAHLTATQSARCAEASREHKVTHTEIMALLTPAQQKTLEASSEGPGQCHGQSPSTAVEHAVHA